MTFSLSPSVDTFEKNVSFTVSNLPSAKTGMVVRSDWGPAYQIVPLTTDAELVSTFANPTDYNYLDWFDAWNFLQYASSLYTVRPIDQALITKNTGLALAGGDGTIAAKLALVTHQGTNLAALYNGDVAESTLDAYNAASYIKTLSEYTESAGTWTITLRSQLREQQLVQKAASGADSGILQIGGQDTLIMSGTAPFDVDCVDFQNLGGWDLTHTLTVVATASFAAGEVITVTNTSGSSVIYVGTILTIDDGTTLTVNAVDVELATAAYDEVAFTVTGNISGTTTGTVVPRLNNFNATATALTGTVSDIRLHFFHKFVTNTQDLGVAICSNAASWTENVSTDITNTFASYFEFMPTFNDGITGGKREFAVIVFKAETDGSFTDLEKFTCSYEKNGRDTFNKNIYVEEVFLNTSEYLYCKVGDTAATLNVNTGGGNLPRLHHSSYDAIYPRINSALVFPSVSDVTDGAYDPGGYVQADIDDAFLLFGDSETFDVNILLTHELSFDEAATTAISRKDCIALVGPFDSTEMVGKTSTIATTYMYEKFGTVDSATPLYSTYTTYAAVYGNMKYQFDKYNDTNRWMSCLGDVAGLMAETDINNDPWWAVAGLTRGKIRNAIKLAFNPNKANRDSLYTNAINPIVSIPGEGSAIVLGQKTVINVSSAFDRINVRRLMITIEKALATALRPFMFEFNDVETRGRVAGVVTPYLAEVKARRGLYDYLVVVDATNNPASIIDQNALIVDVFLKPTKVAEFIEINLTVTTTGTKFNELVS